MTEQEQRQAVVTEALSWTGTPYRKRGRIKGVGCDCGSFLAAVYESLGLLPHQALAIFASDWYKHTTEQRYLKELLKVAKLITEDTTFASLKAEPGNLALTKFGSDNYNHGGIVVRWPYVVHAFHGGVMKVDASRDPMWANQPVAILDWWRANPSK